MVNNAAATAPQNTDNASATKAPVSLLHSAKLRAHQPMSPDEFRANPPCAETHGQQRGRNRTPEHRQRKRNQSPRLVIALCEAQGAPTHEPGPEQEQGYDHGAKQGTPIPPRDISFSVPRHVKGREPQQAALPQCLSTPLQRLRPQRERRPIPASPHQASSRVSARLRSPSWRRSRASGASRRCR